MRTQQALQAAREAIELLRNGILQMKEHAESYGQAFARAYVKEYLDLLSGSAEEQFRALNAMHHKLADVANSIVKGYDALAIIDEALAEPENRCVRELREYAKENPGTYIFPRWDGNRVLKYLAARPAPAQQDIDWKEQYENQKRHAEMWRAKYEAVAGPDTVVNPQAPAQVNAKLLEALQRAQGDINWMLNSRQFLSGDVFDYIDEAIAQAEGEKNAV